MAGKKPIPWSEVSVEMQNNVRRMLKKGLTFSWNDSRSDKTIQYTDEQVDALFRGEGPPPQKGQSK